MNMNFKKKILMASLVPMLTLSVIIMILAETYIKNSIVSQVEQSLKGSAVATLAAYDQNTGEYMETSNGDIWKGAYNISQSEKLVDTIKEESGMEVTFFYGSRRVMTSALDANGQRILGSPAGDKIVEIVLEGGKEYFSENVSVDGTTFCGYYVPVYQTGGSDKPIGMVFAGINKEEAYRSVKNVLFLIIGVVIITSLICVFGVGFMAKSITKSLKRSISGVQSVSSGELNVVFDKKDLKRKDEVGDLTRAIKVLQEELRKIIGGISSSTNQLLKASDEMESLSHDTLINMNHARDAVEVITNGALKQAEDTGAASDNMNRMGALIIATGRDTKELNGSADVMKESGDNAFKSIMELKSISKEVQNAVKTIARQTVETNESAQKIKQASDFISEIASETALLSLNASIEAARAGEAGKGFAVVATQIQKLAEQSDSASKKIDDIVNALIYNSELAVNTMTNMEEVICSQNHYILHTEEIVNQVMTEIQSSITGIKGIERNARELEELRISIETVIHSLSDIAGDNVAGTQETNSLITEMANRFGGVEEAAGNLRETAKMLELEIQDFNINETVTSEQVG